jgi:ornithine cyclodeaminase/alanine dehydrogenase-like protein (mu-crystallin family)
LPGSVRGAMGAYIHTDLDRRIHHENVMIFSIATGEPLILFQDCSINEYRTGTAGAIGAKYLAR